MKDQIIIRIISDVFFIIVICLLFYPLVSDDQHIIRYKHQKEEYDTIIQDTVNEDSSSLLQRLEEYNHSLISNEKRFILKENDMIEYEELLNIQNGIMCYVTIDKIGAKDIPVYHSVSSSALQNGAGHMPGSSMPIGGDSIHTVISGHTGMSGMKMFTELSKLTYGDTFEIHVLDKIIVYQVDEINTVLPDDISKLGIEPNKNYCTLITCTPLGLNTHRLLVRGAKVTEFTEKTDSEQQIENQTDPEKPATLFTTYSTLSLVFAGIAIIILIKMILSDAVFYINLRRLYEED